MAGTISRGIRAPIVSAGDDIVKIVVDSVLKAQEEDGFSLKERDIIAVTESVVARGVNLAVSAREYRDKHLGLCRLDDR